MPPESTYLVGLPMAMTLGFFFGMGPCILSCLPYLAPVFMSNTGGIRGSWRILLPHSLGRLTGYSCFGLAAGLAGEVINDHLEEPLIRLVLGYATLVVGLTLLYRLRDRKTCNRHAGGIAEVTLSKRRDPVGMLPDGLYFLGLSMSFVPCVPLNIVMLSSAASASGLTGFTLGLGFGIGAITMPAVVYGLGVAYFSTRLRLHLGKWLPRLETLSAGLLIIIGAENLLRSTL